MKKPSHYAVRDLLIERAGRFPADDGGASWQLRQLHLVGLAKHAAPVVYLADRHPRGRDEEPKAEEDIPTRGVDAFARGGI